MIAYNDIGKGTPIVFIHGLGSKKEAWIPQHKLSKKYRLIIPDLRGHGETELDTDISVKNFAGDIIELLDSLNINSAYFCGLSLGGIVVQEIHRQKPNMVIGLILSNTTSYISSFFSCYIMYKASQNFKNEDFAEHIVNGSLHNKLYKEEALNYFLIKDTYMKSANAPIGKNYFPSLLTIDKPVLLIGWRYDKVTPLMNMYAMQMFIKNSKSIILDSGHLSNVEQRDKFNQLVDEFVAS